MQVLYKYFYTLLSLLLLASLFSCTRDRTSTAEEALVAAHTEGVYRPATPAEARVRPDRYAYDITYFGNADRGTPLVIYLHEGAFITGSKNDHLGVRLQEDISTRNIAFAKINYYQIPDLAANFKQMVISYGAVVARAMTDAYVAVDYFRRNAGKFNIDPGRIYLMGYSAGAMTALHAAHTSEQDWNGIYPKTSHLADVIDAGLLTAVPEVAGVIGIAGGIMSDGLPVTSTAPVPTLLFHHEDDKMIPIDEGAALVEIIEMLEESKDIREEIVIKIEGEGETQEMSIANALIIPDGLLTGVLTAFFPKICGSRKIRDHYPAAVLFEPNSGTGHSFMVHQHRGKRGSLNGDYPEIVNEVEKFVNGERRRRRRRH